ncbi:MAG TPA: hypothetical protein PK006_04530 [Saprospiraceae bacterium]|nr:hypothetical protein [Saprospiraceae bacterium]
MKNSYVSFSLIVFIAFVVFSSFNKQKAANNLILGSWHPKSQLIDDSGQANFFEEMDSCMMDDRFIFYNNGMLEFIEDGVLCTEPFTSKQYTYTLEADKLIFFIGNLEIEYKLNAVTTDQLILHRYNNKVPAQLVEIFKFVK